MSLAKSIKVIFAFAMSGGFVLIMSGSALADTSGSGTTSVAAIPSTPAQSNNSTITHRHNGSRAAVGAASAATGDTATSAGTAGGTPLSPQTTQADSTTAPASNGSASSSTDGTAPVVSSDANGTSTVPSGAADVAANSLALASVPAANAVITSPAPKPVPQNSMVINSAIFTIQPNVTASRPMFYDDLAGMVPSAPIAPSKDAPKKPVPAQPSGVLDQLTAELAGIVVPPVFFSPTLGQTGFAVMLAGLMLLSLIALKRVALTFGAYLRRGGYAHAARSDVAGATFSSLFATPFRLGYVLAAVPAHSPFLMVSDMKSAFFPIPNAIRKEDMRCY